MSQHAIRAASLDDAPRIGAILSAWVDEIPWVVRIHSHDDDQVHAAMLVQRGWVSVACLDGAVAGFLARDGGEIHALYVAHGARGRGLGKALLEGAKRQSDRLGLWTFQANRRAQAFYLREGFCEVGRSDGADNDEGLPDIRYEWRRI